MTPPVQQSPGVPSNPDDGSDSNARLLTKRELRLMREAEAQVAEQVARNRRIKNYIWGAVGLVVATIATTVSTLAFGQSAIDGGAAKVVAPIEKRVTTVEADLVIIKAQVASTERSSIRSEAMLEMVLNNRGLTPPPKVSPDGGAP